jgi:hexosaminidase
MTGAPAPGSIAPARRSPRSRMRPAALVLVGVACLLTTSATPARTLLAANQTPVVVQPSHTGLAQAPVALAKVAPEPDIVPKPVTMTAGRGWFSVTARTRIVVPAGQAAALAVARDLAGYLRPATGYPLPAVTGTPGPGDVALALGATGIKADTHGEGYRLTVTPSSVHLVAQAAHGLYDGIQSIRQLLSPWINSPTRRAGPWSMPAVSITDYPRYAYRGVMLDIARHYEPPSAVQKLISQAAAYKIDVLHLHISDDQGFRLVINGFPRLSKVGGQGSVGTGGRVMDPGGFWTQAQYRAVVADAAAHFMTVVPEVDSPGHNNAIIMSEYDDTANPHLHGDPDNIDCSVNNPPQWNYTEDVGYSALCPASGNTWAIMTAIIDQLSALSPGPYYDMGGDEVPSNVLSSAQYASFVTKEAAIVHARKTPMGWADIAGPGTRVPRGSVAEYWEPAGGSSSGTATAHEAVAKGMKIVMAPANHTYLDQKYLGGTRGDEPPGLGQTWACPEGCDLSAAYNWNPGSFVTGVTDRNVIGVEGAVWTETLVNLSAVDYMTFPRLIALAEVAWSPSAHRALGSAAYRNFLHRMSYQGARLMAAGVNFYPSTDVHWKLAATGAALTASHGRALSATLATVAAPGVRPGSVITKVSWGDGGTTRTGVTGRSPSGSRLNSLYTVHGTHTYAHAGLYHGTVTIQARGGVRTTADFTVQVS